MSFLLSCVAYVADTLACLQQCCTSEQIGVWWTLYIYFFVSHTCKRLFFCALKSYNMTWSATPSHLVNVPHRGKRPTTHSRYYWEIPCDLQRQNSDKWGNGTSVSWLASTWLQTLQCKQRHCATHCKLETKKTGDGSNACACLYRVLKLLTNDHSDFAAA